MQGLWVCPTMPGLCCVGIKPSLMVGKRCTNRASLQPSSSPLTQLSVLNLKEPRDKDTERRNVWQSPDDGPSQEATHSSGIPVILGVQTEPKRNRRVSAEAGF